MIKKNVLFLVHVEDSFRKFFGNGLEERLVEACQDDKYDKVIILVSNVCDDKPIAELVEVTGSYQWVDWGWGYEPEVFEDQEEEKQWVIPANGHEWTWVPPELRENQFKNYNIFVGGGCQSECLQDFLDILDHLGYDYKTIRKLIY